MKPNTANGSVDSDVLLPTDRAFQHLLAAKPTQPGTIRIFAVDKDGALHAQGAAAQAGLANELNILRIDGPFFNVIKGFILRYTNTNNTAGTVKFWGARGGMG